jgi:WD40 repeat protein
MPPSLAPNLAGAPMGLQMTEVEGRGFGRCLAVLAGGRSGGHQAAVMGAVSLSMDCTFRSFVYIAPQAFHDNCPLIATCGMDRTVKIWRLPIKLDDPNVFTREDKPIFSSSRIHKSCVLSVSWYGPLIVYSSFSHDMLLG